VPGPTVRPLHVGDTHAEGASGPMHAYALSHPDGLVLVDTGMIDRHPEIDEYYRPTLRPLTEHDLPLDEVVAVINTHLHFDHCGGNRLFPGVPIYVQRAELEAARGPDYTIPEWVDFEGATYVELEGEAEIAPGIRVLPTPGHTPGHQSVLVDTDEGLVVVAGDVAHTLEDLEGESRLLELEPVRIWITHSAEPWEAT
jgi:N-acyl homoserine lactone hydrolase